MIIICFQKLEYYLYDETEHKLANFERNFNRFRDTFLSQLCKFNLLELK